MKDFRPLTALVIIIAILCATFIGYKIAQNNRYTPMSFPQITILWDNWEDKPILEPYTRAEYIYNLYHVADESYKENK
jgi:hypothetical protein